MTNKELNVLREKIAALSSGEYYNSIFQWWSLLGKVIQNVCGECKFFVDDYPQVYNDEGRNVLRFDVGEVGYIVSWSYYRMPVSGRWEIVCYLT